jgi:stage III sporulation protein AG
MEIKNLSKGFKSLISKLNKNVILAVALFLGVAMLLIPNGLNTEKEKKSVAGLSEPPFSLAEQEGRIAAVLSKISGAGKVEVILTLKNGVERELAEDKTGTDSQVKHVMVQSGVGTDTVTVRYNYPVYQGALVVCQGASSSSVRLQITEAVRALTGLTADKITVTKMD